MYNILLVEDNPDHAELELRVIRKAHSDVNTVWLQDGKDAHDYIFREGRYAGDVSYDEPDLILLDINLPTMDGMTILRKMKETPAKQNIPVLAVSAQADDKSRLEMLQTGAVDFVTKPFKVLELRARVGTHLKMKEAYKKLAETEKLVSLGVLSMGFAHEIRNRLNIINSALFILQGYLPEDNDVVKRNLANIDSEVKRTITLINDLMMYSKPKKPYMEPITVEELVGDSINQATTQMHLSSITVSNNTVKKPLPRLRADYSQAIMICNNIVFNAVQAMPDGGTLTIDSEITAFNAKSFVDIIYSDTGTGIADDVMPRIFDPLFTTKASGTGLGLSISRGLIREMGGDILVTSKSGEGARFVVRFPAE